jgi:hypothetical protein
MSLKTINIEPEHLKVSNRKSKRKVPVLSINEPNLRQVLLNKLIQRRKTQKKTLVLPVNEGGFDDPMTVSESGPSVSIPSVSSPLAEPIETCPVINPDKPYGVLKNGTKPTFKEWTLNNKDPPVENVPLPENVSLTEPVTLAQPAHIIKKIKVGKNKRTRSVDVLIENIHTRKLNKEKFQLLKKTNITTIKNYLKNRQFIKIGSNAPNSLIRYMYENIKECGDVVNENKSNLIHNFTKDTSF